MGPGEKLLHVKKAYNIYWTPRMMMKGGTRVEGPPYIHMDSGRRALHTSLDSSRDSRRPEHMMSG